MANHTSLASLFSDIADAIRAKTGGSSNIIADNFPTAISQIPTGGTPTLQTKTKTYTPTTSQQTEQVRADNGYDGLEQVNVTVNAMPTGSAGTPIASKGTVSNHSVTVTPSVTNTTGYINGGTKTGTGVSVSASELVSGTKSITQNGTGIDVANYASVDVNVSGGGGASLGTKTITANGTYDAEDDGYDGYSSVDVNVSGGGGIGTLLKTQTLGKISTSSTNATDTGLTVSVSDINSYDLLVVETSVDSVVNSGHNATVNLFYLINESNVSTKNAVKSTMGAWNCKRTSGTASTRYNTTSYGVYPMNASISNGDITWQVYKRYNSTQTGTLYANYTTRVYGIKLYDLIGG